MRTAFILSSMLAVAACTPAPDNVAVANMAIVTEPAPLATEAPATKAAPVDTAPRPALNIAPDGVSLVDIASGRARILTFGTARNVTTAAAVAALGKPLDTGEQAECGAGPLAYERFSGGLSLQFQRGRFVGWNLTGGGTFKLTNATGIGIGSTRTDLMAVLDAKVEQTSLGTEFTAGDMAGLLSGTAADAKITDLWAGLTCIAR